MCETDNHVFCMIEVGVLAPSHRCIQVWAGIAIHKQLPAFLDNNKGPTILCYQRNALSFALLNLIGPAQKSRVARQCLSLGPSPPGAHFSR